MIDTGASVSITPILEDFVTPLDKKNIPEMRGVTELVQVIGTGTVEWTIRAPDNRICIIRTQAHYIPTAHIRLFSPQTYFREQSNGSFCEFDHNSITLHLKHQGCYSFPFHYMGNTPLMEPVLESVARSFYPSDPQAFDPIIAGLTQHHLFDLEHRLADTQSLLDSNHNLSPGCKELLLWHNRFAHAGFSWIQDLMRPRKNEVGERADPGFIKARIPQAHRCAAPKCPACLLSRQHRRTPDSTRHVPNKAREMAIRTKDLNPGDCVSIDQYISGTPGRLPYTFGKEKSTAQFSGGTLFYDHASAFVFLRNQVSLQVGETLVGKRDFERLAETLGVRVRAYRADNHPFASDSFKEDLDANGQTITFSGVGAHHMNGAAERAVKTITSWARALLMHQLLHWPSEFDPKLWPFAMEYAAYIWNTLPRGTGKLSPVELFSRTRLPNHDHLDHIRVWGSPVFVLDPILQDSKKLPKWKPRSRLGMFVGISPNHSHTVSMILNLHTGNVSPQYHLVFDEMFTSVRGTILPDVFNDAFWQSLLTDGYSQLVSPADQEIHVLPDTQAGFDEFDETPEEDPPPHDTSSVPEGESEELSTEDATSEVSEGVPEPPAPPEPRRSSRHRPPNPRYAVPLTRSTYPHGRDTYRKTRISCLNNEYLHGLTWDGLLSSLHTTQGRQVFAQMARSFDPVNQTQEDWNPLALAARANDADTPNWHQAMNGPYAKEFWAACETELETLRQMNVWDVVDREPWMNVLPSTWAFKLKRYADGLLRKVKARFCARGDRQIEGIDFFETYAPVVSWTTVRLMLILSIQLNLVTQQHDYTAAFVHADIDKPPNYEDLSEEEKRRSGVYVEMPKGFSEPGKVLKLKKSLYGLKQAPRTFFEHISGELQAVGFQQMVDVDPCLFISDKVVCLLYVDDSYLCAENEEDINEVVRKLNERGMQLSEEEKKAPFLGVKIDKLEDGTIRMNQTGLIDRIIEALGCEDLPPVDTPVTETLPKDPEGEPAQGTFNYASVIGMLWYLVGHTRPDLCMAVSQAARFTYCPKRSHEEALIRIGQYLKKTRDGGMLFKPTGPGPLKVEVFVDSDFLGLYGKESRTDPTSVKSRTGYLIRINGCPVIWSSKLQDSIALSTMMAEYYALSTALKEVIPLRELIKVISKHADLADPELATFKTTVWEDNIGAQTLATLEPGHQTPRSKFYDVKVHWFRQYVKDKTIEVKRIDTSEQLADIFTKPSPREPFERIRKLILGW